MLKKYPFITITYTTCILLLSAAYVAGITFNIPFVQIVGDPALITKVHPFTGIISNIGVLIWCATSTICLFSGVFLWRFKQRKEAIFLISSGVLTFILLIDDFFMFHDYILRSFKAFKIKQTITYPLYILLTLWYVKSFLKLILTKTNYFILGMAFTFLGLSMGLDFFMEDTNLKYFIEDALKFVGIFSWLVYFARSSYVLILDALSKPSH